MEERPLVIVCAGLASLALCAWCACSDNQSGIAQASFHRPGAMAFVCYDAEDRPVDLGDCEDAPDGFELYGLVAQVGRGEVAALNLTKSRLVDSDTRIPGYTFVPAGELPSAVRVPATNAHYAYVADFGSEDVRAISLDVFHDAQSQGDTQLLGLAAGPTDLALSPAGDALYAALPAAGTVIRIPLDEEGRMGDPEAIELAAEVPVAVASDGTEPTYCKACPDCDSLLAPPVVAPRDTSSAEASARPVAFAVDAPGHRLFVADEASPVLHVIDLEDSEAGATALNVGVPTRAVVVTPEVPGVVGDATDVAQYAYAIDATDGSMLVVDLGSGAVLSVDPGRGRAADRIPLPAPVMSLELATPGFPGDTCELGSDNASAASPTRLRGVFVAVGLTDGTLRIIDVHDLDATCRGGDAECENPPTTSETTVFIRRHRPRIGERVRDPVPSVTRFEDGASGQEAGLALEAIATCPGGMGAIHDVETSTGGTETLICGLTDPWAMPAQAWSVDFEGVLPNASEARGRLGLTDDDEPVLFASIDLCAVGTLGSDDVPSDGPEAGYAGDVLVITSEPPPSTEDSADCDFWERDADGDAPYVAFAIVRAFDDHLVLKNLPRAKAGDPDVAFPVAAGEDPITFAGIADCFVELVSYEIRAQDAFVVTGSETGGLHRIHAAANDACEVDPSQDEALQLRAQGGLFANPVVAFEPAIPATGSELTAHFAVGALPSKLGIVVGELPSVLAFDAPDNRLYAVDAVGGAVLEVDLTRWREIRKFD